MLMRTADSRINESAPWSDDDNEALTGLYMITPQPGYDEVGRHLGRSEKAVYARVMRLAAQLGSDEYLVRYVLDRKTGKGHVKIVQEGSGLTVMVRACRPGDTYLVDTAIICWRAGVARRCRSH